MLQFKHVAIYIQLVYYLCRILRRSTELEDYR